MPLILIKSYQFCIFIQAPLSSAPVRCRQFIDFFYRQTNYGKLGAHRARFALVGSPSGERATMAFEIIHSLRHHAGQPPARRLSARLVAALAVLAVVWACVIAYHAQPVEAEQGQSADAR
jgi:hypothetical protein